MFLDAVLNDHRWALGFCSLLALGVAVGLYRQQALSRSAFMWAVMAILAIGSGLILSLS